MIHGKALARYLCLALLLGMASACSVSRFVPEGEHLLDHVSVRSTDKSLSTVPLQGYMQQHPNSKWFGLLKVPMSPYLLSGRDSSKWVNRFLQRIGQAPVIYSPSRAQRTRDDLEAAVRNMGYLQARVSLIEKKKRTKLRALYEITPGPLYHVGQLAQQIGDSAVRSVIDSARHESNLREGMPFDMNVLDQERARINRLLRNTGYFRFNKEYIRFEADTTLGNQQVWLNLVVDDFRTTTDGRRLPHPVYTIASLTLLSDSMMNRRTIRQQVLRRKNRIEVGSLYQEQQVQATYNQLASLGAVMNSNIQMRTNPEDSTKLDAVVTVMTNKPHSFNFELEGTNSAGDLGAAVSLSYQNRNLMHGSELLNMKVRGAYEAIKGLEGYDNQDYIEYGAEVSLGFPDLKIPGLSRRFHRKVAGTSELALMYDSQDRPEFHRRVVTGVWRYRWHTANRHYQHRIDMVDLNYVFMPWISSTFQRDYLEDATSRNAILRYNYENLFIMKFGYTLNYSSLPQTGILGSYGTNAWNVRLNMESAGNLLYGATSLFGTAKNSHDRYTLLNIAYAQYVKGDLDFAKSFRFTPNNSLAFHLGLGVAYPYGNSTILPYEKRYFSGGANSVRGWSVRELGPGSFQGADGRIDFINQTGDIKLDVNVEYRSHLFWLLDGAAFVDAGNIWTFRSYAEQPGGQFRLDKFWKQIAVSYGLGLRMNFNYFILRLDAGMKAVHPGYTDGKRRYPLIHPNFGRDFALHFAVGLPF